MKKTGKVLNFDKEKVYIITAEKEFVTVYRNSDKPQVDKLYTGEVFKKDMRIVPILTWIILICVALIFIIKFAAFKSNATVVVSFGNTNVKLGVKNNIITKVQSTDKTSLKILDNAPVSGNEVNNGLIILFDEAMEEKLITKYTGYDTGDIYVFVTKGSDKEVLNLEEFKKYLASNNYDLLINKSNNKID